MSKIAIVGEFWTKAEEEAGGSFSPSSSTGRLLRGLLTQAGINPSDCFFTHLFRTQANDIKQFCTDRHNKLDNYPPVVSGKYIDGSHRSELLRLHNELNREAPNVIVASGTAALWALCGRGKSKPISAKSFRGAPIRSDLGYKVIPTYSISGLFRDWSNRPVVLSDLAKALTESTFPEVRRPVREIWVNPTFEDLELFKTHYIDPSPDLSIDIETLDKYITSIAFAPREDVSLVIPLIRKSLTPYWPNPQTELAVWNFIKTLCGLKKNIIGQNFMFDMHRLWRTYGVPVPHAQNDTMLLHHSLYIELEKGLGFLGSVYTTEARWKGRRKHESMKKEDE